MDAPDGRDSAASRVKVFAFREKSAGALRPVRAGSQPNIAILFWLSSFFGPRLRKRSFTFVGYARAVRGNSLLWICGAITFVAVISVSLWRAENPSVEPADEAQVPAITSQAAVSQPATSSAQTSEAASPEAFSPEPPEDGRAMLDAAAADPDPAVRDEAAALSQLRDAESSAQDE
jgi:hypothetical protein